jgi:hypothetical protein
VGPEAGEAGETGGGEAEGSGGEEHDVFEETDVVGGGEVAGAEVEDGVGDELAGAVKGDVAAAVALDDLGAALGKGVGVDEEVFGPGAAAECVDGRVLEDGERLGRAVKDGGGGVLLPAPGVVVVDEAGAAEADVAQHEADLIRRCGRGW